MIHVIHNELSESMSYFTLDFNIYMSNSCDFDTISDSSYFSHSSYIFTRWEYHSNYTILDVIGVEILGSNSLSYGYDIWHKEESWRGSRKKTKTNNIESQRNFDFSMICHKPRIGKKVKFIKDTKEEHQW